MLNRVARRCLLAGLLLAFAGCSHSGTSPGTTTSDSSSNSSSATPAPPPPAPAPVVIPAGTTLTVTLDQTVGTKNNESGDRFDASLAAPITVDGKEIVPSGAKAAGTVVTATPAGRLKGGSILALTLDSIRVNGEKYSIETSQFEQAGKGRGKRTLIGGGGGAALGAIVGGIAGGGKGAAIGAVAGGGAGTAGAAYTGQRDITLPAETRLHFKLRRSLEISQQ